MSNTVVGIFEYESEAQQAQNYLLANGFADGDVDIKTASYKSADGVSEDSDRDEGLLDRIGNFFKDLFDGDEEETKRYTEAGKRGTIVTVHAASVEEASAAAEILDQHGAVDVKESVANFSSNQASDSTEADPFFSNDQTASLPDTNSPEVGRPGFGSRSRIIQRPIQESTRLRQDSLNVGTPPVNGFATGSDFDTFKGGSNAMNDFEQEAGMDDDSDFEKTMDADEIDETGDSKTADVDELTDRERTRRFSLDE